MITDLNWKESTSTDSGSVWQKTDGVLRLVSTHTQRRTWAGQLSLITMHIVECDMYYLVRVYGNETNWLDSWFSLCTNGRDCFRQYIAPDLEDAKRGALETALGFLKRDLVIVCGELGMPVP